MGNVDEHGGLRPGQLVANRYRVVELLGLGGMGAVYEAEHVELGNRVALKVMLPRFGENAAMLQRFVNEARAAARIGHPGIVQVFDLGTGDEGTFIAMEKLDGEELQQRIERTGPLDPARVVEIGIELADALAAAHEHGIVHRDLKPSNIFLCNRGRTNDVVKVLDFGIAKLSQGLSAGDTRTGAVLGTPLYMPPEQLKDSKQVEPRTDVYAMGAVLYHALVGTPPFDATTWPELAYKITSVAPVPPKELRPEVPVWLSDLVMQALHKSPADRPSSAKDLAEALQSGGTRTHPVPAERTLALQSAQPIEPSGSSVAAVEARSDDHFAPLASTTPEKASPRHWTLWAGAIVALGAVSAFVVWRDPTNAPVNAADEPAALPTKSALAEQQPSPRVSLSTSVAAAPSAKEPATVAVRITSLPAGATVSVDGKPGCARTPCSIELSDGAHTVIARLGGFVTMRRALSPPLPAELQLPLVPDPPSTVPATKRPPGAAPPPLVPP